jgi:phosphatidylethanolamine-binding protein (PEBP) family uncharacterized protein
MRAATRREARIASAKTSRRRSPGRTRRTAPKAFALLLFDPEGRPPAGVSHMVVYGIPADVKGFAEGELSKPSDKFIGGKSTMGLGVYFGPGTPPNTDWHHYTWTIVATDLDPKALQPGMTREELAAALKDHVKGSAGLVTRFRHPT